MTTSLSAKTKAASSPRPLARGKDAKFAPRQLLFFLGCLAPLSKLILMPAQLAAEAKNDLWLSALISFAVETAAVFAAVLLAKRRLSFFELLERAFGRAAAYFGCMLLALFLLLAAYIPLFEQKLMVQSIFYDTLPSDLLFAPFFLLSVYFCLKPLGSFGRVFDLLGPLAALAFLFLVLFSAGEADFAALAPVGAAGAGGILKGVLNTAAWFFDGALVLALLGKIEYQRGLAWKAAAVHGVGGGAVLLFLALFYGIFQDIAPVQFFAFAKTAKYFPAIDLLGRIDYIFLYALALCMLFASLFPLLGAAELCKQSFGESKPRCLLYALLLNGAMAGVSTALGFAFPAAERFLTRTLFWLFPLFGALLPALLLLTARRRA